MKNENENENGKKMKIQMYRKCMYENVSESAQSRSL